MEGVSRGEETGEVERPPWAVRLQVPSGCIVRGGVRRLGGMGKAWIMCLLVFISLSTTQAANLTAEGMLYDSVFQNYNKQIRPIGDNGHAVSVILHIALHQVSYLNAEQQSLKNLVVVTAKWKDDNLKWVPADHSDISFMILPSSDFWLPDFGVSNSATQFYDDNNDNFRLQLKHTGDIVWSFGGHVTTKCDVIVDTFPFDKQLCEFSISNWMYDVSAVNLTLEETHMDTDEYVRNVEWDLLSTSCRYKSLVHMDRDGRTYPSVFCNMILRRYPTFYVINIFVPAYFILLLFLAAFWLPPGHRAVVPLQMTTLLIYSVMILNTSKYLPHTSTIPHITSFAVVVIAMATFSIILTVFISVMRIYMETSVRVPKSVRTLAFNYLAAPLCLKSIANDVKRKTMPDENEGGMTTETSLNDVVKVDPVFDNEKGGQSDQTQLLTRLVNISEEMNIHLSSISSQTKSNPRAAMIRAEWDLLSKVSARLAFWLILIIVIGLTIEFVIAVSVHGDPHPGET